MLQLVLLTGCSFVPARREMDRVKKVLGTVDTVAEVHLSCGGRVLASDSLCADVVMKDGARLRFDRVGFDSLGANAVNVFVAAAGGLVPRVANCEGTGAPNFHRDGALGHHFQPTLIDVKDAAFRYREILEEVEFWPQCPQFYEVQDKRGRHFRYCARRKDAAEEPPRPSCP